MDLVQLTQPLFLDIVSITRQARLSKGQPEDFQHKRRLRLESMEVIAKKKRIGDAFESVRLPLIYFADSMMTEGPNEALAEWWKEHRLAVTMSGPAGASEAESAAPAENNYGGFGEDHNYSGGNTGGFDVPTSSFDGHESLVAGDDEFFVLMRKALQKTDRWADERLFVFYTCLAAGFRSKSLTQKARQDELAKLRTRLANADGKDAESVRRKDEEYEGDEDDGDDSPRFLETDHDERVTPENYSSTADRILLTRHTPVSVGVIVIISVTVVLVVMVTNFILYNQAKSALADRLAVILQHEKP